MWNSWTAERYLQLLEESKSLFNLLAFFKFLSPITQSLADGPSKHLRQIYYYSFCIIWSSSLRSGHQSNPTPLYYPDYKLGLSTNRLLGDLWTVCTNIRWLVKRQLLAFFKASSSIILNVTSTLIDDFRFETKSIWPWGLIMPDE